jgi:hypothetical protein
MLATYVLDFPCDGNYFIFFFSPFSVCLLLLSRVSLLLIGPSPQFHACLIYVFTSLCPLDPFHAGSGARTPHAMHHALFQLPLHLLRHHRRPCRRHRCLAGLPTIVIHRPVINCIWEQQPVRHHSCRLRSIVTNTTALTRIIGH